MREVTRLKGNLLIPEEAKMRSTWTILAILALAVAPAPPSEAANIADFEVYSLLDQNNNVLLPGRLHVPSDYATDPDTLRPLILFLHGAGESGTNNVAQINGNIDNLLAAAKDYGSFLYAPQTDSGWGGATRLADAMTMIDRAIDERSVDPNRIYVTGLSMGGGGSWNFLNQFSDRVAATVPICGSPPTRGFMPSTVVDEPIWAFHGRFDSTVPATVTRNVINSLLTEAGLPHPTYPPLNTFGPHVQFDFPPLDLHYTDMRGGHGIWPEVYNTPAMYEWLFAHGRIPEPGTLALALIACGAAVPRSPRFKPQVRTGAL
jgi:predicted peptidase